MDTNIKLKTIFEGSMHGIYCSGKVHTNIIWRKPSLPEIFQIDHSDCDCKESENGNRD